MAALIALMIVLFVGVISFIIVCCCLRHWVISPSDDLKKKDALIKKAILDDLTTTENPLWIEQWVFTVNGIVWIIRVLIWRKLKLYEEQELTMQVFNEPELGTTNRRNSSDHVPVSWLFEWIFVLANLVDDYTNNQLFVSALPKRALKYFLGGQHIRDHTASSSTSTIEFSFDRGGGWFGRVCHVVENSPATTR